MLEMLLSALVWLLALELFALVALPLSHQVFSRLPDRGYAFSKLLGLLGVTYATWLIGLSHTLPNSGWTVFLAALAVAVASWLAARHQGGEMLRFARSSAPTIIVVETLFIAVFVGVMLLRASTPDIVHTEQPMDLMFLNATVASPHYPPTDPWLAGVEVSYYYFGYLMIGSVAMATGTATSVAYNLGLATVAAMGAVAAFGVSYNLVGLARGSVDARVLAGLMGAFLLLAASNLVGALELVRAAGGLSAGFWEYIGVAGLTAPEGVSMWRPEEVWWWWRASRVIPGAIAEFPAFSFVLGDLHPHVISTGFLLLSAGLAVQVYLQQGLSHVGALRRNWPLLLATVATVGALGATNLWDMPVALTLVGGAALLNAVRSGRRLQLGRSVAVSNNVIAVGGASGTAASQETHQARLYTVRDGVWRSGPTLETRGTGSGADLGASIAASDDIVAVGAPRASRTGVVYLYGPWNDGWAHRATLRPPEEGVVRGFGRSVAVAHGLAAVSAQGAVYVYREEPGEWMLDAELPLEQGVSDSDPVVALDGETLAVGLPSYEGGEAYVYERVDGAWERTALDPKSAEPPRLRRFGRSISVRGSRVAVGAAGAVVTFQRNGGKWEFDAAARPPQRSLSFGGSVGVDGNYLVAGGSPGGDRALDHGAACVFIRTNEGWELQSQLQAEDAGPGDLAGSAAAISGDTIVLGAPGGSQGNAFVFRRALDKWEFAWKVGSRWRFPSTATALAAFGLGSVLAALPFLANFESSVSGVLPLRTIMTRPAHLVLVWGFAGFLAAPVLLAALRSIFARGNWSLLRFAVAAFVAFAPVMFWLQPVYGVLIYLLIALLFVFHQAGFRSPKVDEALFAYNSRVTFVIVAALVAAGLLWDGIVSSERGVGGELLAVDRLLVALPMATFIALALYGAWTLAHRDSEAIREAGADRPGATHWNAHAPALLVLVVAGALIMGVELFHVADAFGGDLRRQNTLFKLYYQAWALMAVLGGFGLWFVWTRWDRRRLTGRIGSMLWVALLVVGLGAVSYYAFAAVATRADGSDALRLDGLAHLDSSAPAEAELIRWVREETPRDAVVLQGARVPCPENPGGCDDWKPELARVASATGRPTVIGWAGHEKQWREDQEDISRRQDHVKEIYETTDLVAARALLRRYGVDYVIVGPRERELYGVEGLAKFSELGSPVFQSGFDDGMFRVHRIAAEGEL